MTEATTPANGHGHDPLQTRVDEGPKGGARTWYDVLEVAADASTADVQKAYDRALALVEGRNIGGYLMLDPLAAESARADVEAAYAVLGDVDRRAAYDEKLRQKGESLGGGESRSSAAAPGDKHAESRSADKLNQAEEARTMLAVEEAQHEAQEKAEASTVSSPGLKILAPDPEAPSQTAIRFDVPKT